MATLDELFVREKAWIAACDDVDALLDRIGEWREDARVGEARGHYLMRMRAGDLIELARTRVVKLKAEALQAEERAARPRLGRPVAAERAVRPAEQTPELTVAQREPARPVVRERAAEPLIDRQLEAAEHRRRRDAASTLEAEAKAAATRMANAQAAKIEADAALAKAQAAALVRESARVAVAPAERRVAAAPPERTPPAPTPPGKPPASPPAQPSGPSTRSKLAPTPTRPRPESAARTAAPPRTTASAPAPPTSPALAAPTRPAVPPADQLALMSVGRWPPSGPPPGHPFWSRDQDWPAEWTLTGFDLSCFRGRLNVTQKVLAMQFGVSSAEIADLERRPREKVGPAMQIALHRAMGTVAEGERRRRAGTAEGSAGAREVGERGAPSATPPTPIAPTSPEEGASVTVVGTAPLPPITGSELARLRTERRLSQRQLAERLGVGHGMVAKAEVAAAEPLGERMREAVAAMLGAGSGSATG